MKNIFFLFFSFSSLILRAQYFYTDIVGTLQTNKQMQIYNANKVLRVSASGVDPAGRRTTDFSELQEIKENGKALKISTFNNLNKTVYYNRFDEQGRLTSIIDSSFAVQSTTTYEYDNNGRVIETNEAFFYVSYFTYNKDGYIIDKTINVLFSDSDEKDLPKKIYFKYEYEFR